MLIHELLESITTTPSALTQLIQNSNSLHNLYAERLIPLIKNMYAEGMHEDMFRTTKKVVGQQKGRWFSDNYLSTSRHRDNPTTGLKNALLSLAKDPNFGDARSTLQELGSFTQMMSSTELFKKTEQTSGQYVAQLEMKLPQLLKMLSVRASGDFRERLAVCGTRLKNIIDNFYGIWEKLQKEYDRDWGDTDPDQKANDKRKQEETNRKAVSGSQSASVENIINQVLSGLDRKLAAELRPMLARSDNKLQTLQQELSKRGIKP